MKLKVEEISKDIGEIADKKTISEAVVLIPYVDLGEENFNENGRAKNIPSIVGENDVGAYETKTKGPFYFSADSNIISSVIGNNFRETTCIIDIGMFITVIYKFQNQTFSRFLIR